MLSVSQRKIVKGIRQGNYEAYKTLICQYYKPIYRFVLYLTGQPCAAEDLTQESFTAAWSKIEDYNGRASLGTWLHRIAYNKFVDSKRQLKSESTMRNNLQPKDNVSEDSDPLRRLIADEQAQILYRSISKLEAQESLLIVLHYIQGLSYRQMTQVLDEPGGTIKWRTNQALKKLRNCLSDGF